MSVFFEKQDDRPLADQLRPKVLRDIVGQKHLLASNSPLGRMVTQGKITSFILWGPPGSGKTTIARLLASKVDFIFTPLSAVFSGVRELRDIFEDAKKARKKGHRSLLFVDEIHRFNRLQQDSFLPFVEDGTVVLIGATTENPSFELNAAILSRAQVFVLNRLDDSALERILKRAESHIGRALPVDLAARQALKNLADGDGRYLLNLAEELFTAPKRLHLNLNELSNFVQKKLLDMIKHRMRTITL